MTHKLFTELGLSAELLKAIDKLGFEQASPIQAEAIPALLSGGDVVGQSQTGSGKTAAFAIPAIEKTDPHDRSVQVLILCPTRELAVQVSEEVHKLALFKRGIRALPIYGGQSYERQFYGLREGAQILIGTPGRVMDHMRRGTVRFDALRMAILDEVDVMLNMGFREDIEFILQATPATRQTVFFSATIPRPIQDLIQKHAREPRQIRIEQKVMTVPTVEQVYYEVDRRFKIELLTRLIDIHDYKLGIIFCNTKRMVDDLVDHLNAQGYSADRLHGDMGQNLRDRVMNRFRKSGLEFLVATDVAARGIDVDDVQVVVNYDLPYDPEDYVHRIGRTGRAGRSGRAISFVSGRELFQIQQIERFTRTRIHRQKIPSLDEVQEARDNVFLGKLRSTLQGGEFERQDELIGRLLEEGFTSTDIASALIHHLRHESAPPAPPAGDDSGQGRPPYRDSREAPEVRDRRDVRRREERPRFDRDRGRRDQPDRRGPLRETPAGRPLHEQERKPAPPPPRESSVADQPAVPAAEPGPVVGAEPAPGLVVAPSTKARLAPPSAPAPGPEAPAPATEPVAARSAEPASADRPGPTGGVKSFPSRRPPARPGAVPRESHRRMEREGRRERPERPERGPGAERFGRPTRPERRESRGLAGDESARGEAPRPVAAGKPKKASRRTPGDQTRLYINVGAEMGVSAGDVVGAILGETGLPSKTVGTVDVRDRHVFVDVASEHAYGIIAKLNRALIKGRRVKVKVA